MATTVKPMMRLACIAVAGALVLAGCDGGGGGDATAASGRIEGTLRMVGGPGVDQGVSGIVKAFDASSSRPRSRRAVATVVTDASGRFTAPVPAGHTYRLTGEWTNGGDPIVCADAPLAPARANKTTHADVICDVK